MAGVGGSKLMSGSQVRVVSHHPMRRYLVGGVVLILCGISAVTGVWFAGAKAELDLTYMTALERINLASEVELAKLNDALVEAGLTHEVDRQAAVELRGSIKTLRDEVASLTEEVTFYKSLMSPSSVAQGLQIMEFDLSPAEQESHYSYHLLLTQVANRRDWIQGSVRVNVHGRRSRRPDSAMDQAPASVDDQQVLSLTELGDTATYPLKFRFRYFQALTGRITIPAGFEPRSVVVTVQQRGGNSTGETRTFPWAASR